MKTMFLAAAAVLALSSGVAFAESEGDTAVGHEWAMQTGTERVPATIFYANRGAVPQMPQQHAVMVPQFQEQGGAG